jgi:hypothetical protein
MPGVGDPLDQTSNEYGPVDRGVKSRNQKTVIAPGIDPRQSTRSVASKAVGDQPLATQSVSKTAADLATKVGQRLVDDGG